jgi:hypothetical protein
MVTTGRALGGGAALKFAASVLFLQDSRPEKMIIPA